MSNALDPHAAIVTEAGGLDPGGPLRTADGQPPRPCTRLLQHDVDAVRAGIIHRVSCHHAVEPGVHVRFSFFL